MMTEENITEAVNNIPNNSPGRNDSEGEKITVKRGKVDSIIIYEVSESELSTIESGAPSSLYLNFSTFFGGIFLSFLSVLLTVTFDCSKPKGLIVFILFLLIEIVSFFLTLVMSIIWLVKRKDLSNIIKRIKERIK